MKFFFMFFYFFYDEGRLEGLRRRGFIYNK